jgi:hypothetical protein
VAGWLLDIELHRRHRLARILATSVRSTSDLVGLLYGTIFFFMNVCRGPGHTVWSWHADGKYAHGLPQLTRSSGAAIVCMWHR